MQSLPRFSFPNTVQNSAARPHLLPLTARHLTYQGHHGAVSALTWSPDGDHIASAGGVNNSGIGRKYDRGWQERSSILLLSSCFGDRENQEGTGMHYGL